MSINVGVDFSHAETFHVFCTDSEFTYTNVNINTLNNTLPDIFQATFKIELLL